MDMSIDNETKQLIMNLASKYDKIKKIEDFYSTPSGYKYVIMLTIFVDGDMSTFDSHALANCLEYDINTLDNVSNTIIHVNPI